MAECSESLNNPSNEGKENQKMWPISSSAGKSVCHVQNFDQTKVCEDFSNPLMLKAIFNIQFHTDWLCES
jgi:hypothetical protein